MEGESLSVHEPGGYVAREIKYTIPLFEKAVELSPGNPDANLLLANSTRYV